MIEPNLTYDDAASDIERLTIHMVMEEPKGKVAAFYPLLFDFIAEQLIRNETMDFSEKSARHLLIETVSIQNQKHVSAAAVLPTIVSTLLSDWLCSKVPVSREKFRAVCSQNLSNQAALGAARSQPHRPRPPGASRVGWELVD
jgi:hypothetical protein